MLPLWRCFRERCLASGRPDGLILLRDQRKVFNQRNACPMRPADRPGELGSGAPGRELAPMAF